MKPPNSISPKEFFGSLWLKQQGALSLREYVLNQARIWSVDGVPSSPTYTMFTTPGAMDYLGPGKRVQCIERLYGASVARKSKFIKHFEEKYLCKILGIPHEKAPKEETLTWAQIAHQRYPTSMKALRAGARNIRTARQTKAKFGEISSLGTWQDECPSRLTADDVIEMLSNYVPTVHEGMQWEYVDPPREQASVGLVITDDHWYTGAKQPIWALTFARAKTLRDELMGSGLTWSQIEKTTDYGREIGYELCKRYQLVLYPGWRLDGGPNKLRLLLIGSSILYAIETNVIRNLHHAMLDNPYFGYTVPRVENFFEEGLEAGYKYLSGDIIGFDLHQQPSHLLAVYKGVQKYANLPESLMVAMYLYNSFCPAIALVKDDLGNWGPAIRVRNGQAASGIGMFATMNSVGNAAAQWRTLRETGTPRHLRKGMHMGDNHVVPICMGVAHWRDALQKETGFRMDAADTLRSEKDAYFLRRYFLAGSRESAPNMLSRVRNILFPEYGDPGGMPPLRRALVYRAQASELMFKGNAEFCNSLEKIAPLKYFLYQGSTYSDSDLSAAYNALVSNHWVGSRAVDDVDLNLSRAMQWAHVDNSADLI